MKHILLGKAGEAYAADYLASCGYILLARNYRVSVGEIDIIAMENETLVFIEVKTRKTRQFGLPCEAVDARRILRLQEAAMMYLQDTPYPYDTIRFDVFEVYPVDEGFQHRHLQQVI